VEFRQFDKMDLQIQVVLNGMSSLEHGFVPAVFLYELNVDMKIGRSAGRKLGFYPVAVVQILLCMGTVIGCLILGGQSMKVIC